MEELLDAAYNLATHRIIEIDENKGYADGKDIYFIIPVQDEKVKEEQLALSTFLYHEGYSHCTCPVRNKWGEVFTVHQETWYVVVKVGLNQHENKYKGAEALAHFHHIGATYPFEPAYISSYGKWDARWTDKLTAVEHQLRADAKAFSNVYQQLLMDSLPYIIGISENAIQYFYESLYDKRYQLSDQGTITFQRYSNHMERSVIWLTDLMYDHPVRDIAEWVRGEMLSDTKLTDITEYIQTYEMIRPLSVFSWRILYARLLFPIHFYDFFARHFKKSNPDESYRRLRELLERQEAYERKLKQFMLIQQEKLSIPMVHWL